MQTMEDVVAAFTPVGKLDPVVHQKLLKVETTFKEAATDVLDLVPESADRSVALRLLLQAKMMTVQALTHYKAAPPVKKELENGKKKG